ncbi:dynamin family protein [Neobacillus sp. 179-J 1A1 HS]|uniref:dynamin family protein n=1 Tax=Neobacillus driksii TaxID=3035913 RepID=UPI0035BBE346
MSNQLVSSFIQEIKQLDIDVSGPDVEVFPALFFTSVGLDYLQSRNFQHKTGVKFKHLTRNQLNLSELDVLVIVLGDYEPDKADTQLIRSLLQSDVKIVPFLLLSNQFFEIPEGEIFSYGQYIEALNRLCGKDYHIVAFKEQDLFTGKDEVIKYFQTLKDLKHLMRVKEKLASYYVDLTAVQFSLLKASEEQSSYFEIGITNMLEKEITRLLSEIDKTIHKKYAGVFNGQKGHFTLIQRENLKKVTVSRFPNMGNSWMVAEFGIEFLDISFQIKRFAAKVESSIVGEHFATLINDTNKALQFATNISILGTFSSGKTTFINTFLGANLRTSATHNTTILSEVRHSSDNMNKVSFQYKPIVHLELLSPNNDRDAAIISPVHGIVEDIIELNGIVTIMLRQQDELFSIYLGEKPPLSNVKKGVRINKDERLTDGKHPQHSQVKAFNLYSIAEIEAIIQLLNKDTLKNPKLSIQENGREEVLTKKSSIVSYLSRLKNIAKVKYATIPADELLNGEYSDIRRISFSANVTASNLLHEIVLDADGWETFQGNHQQTGYAESPECYLLLNKAVVYLKNDFLQLANIVDTPGLGSITDLHDEITESYLRDAKGILMIMIKMDNHIERESLWKLLSLLNSVYKNKSRQHVYFFCNWYRNLRTWKEIERTFAYLRDILIGFGFNKENIFLCNLESVIKHGIEDERLGEFPSYGLLKERLKRDIANLGPMYHLSKLNESWNLGIRTNLYNLKGRSYQLQQDIKQREFRKKNLKNIKDELETISLSSVEVFTHLKEVVDNATSLLYKLDTKKTWDEYGELLVVAMESINNAYNDNELLDEIHLKMLEMKSKLKKLNISVTFPDVPEPALKNIPFGQLRKKIQEIINDWPLMTFYFGSYRDNRRCEVRDWVNEHVDLLKESFKDYFNQTKNLFLDFKEKVIVNVTDELKLLENTKAVDIMTIQTMIDEIERNVKPTWNKILKNMNVLQSERETNEHYRD